MSGRTRLEHITTMRILLVEDEVDVRRFFARALAHIAPAAQVVEAADGLEALAAFQNEPFDLILSDHKMPNMTGLELLQAVRATSTVPFLLVTAFRSVEADALAAGVSDMLNKPISITALRSALARYLPI
jgi:CheY-like chemotaxis protein